MKLINYQDFKRIQRLSLNDFNRWVQSIYKSGFSDGLEEGGWISDGEIFVILRSEKIGEERANRIVDKIIKSCGGDPWTMEAT